MEVTDVCIRQILTHQSSPGECAVPGCLGCRAIRTGIGYPANHTERCRERIGQELEKELEGASRVARDRERISRARHEERARDMRIEDPDQRLDREVIEGNGASSSRDGVGNEPPSRPAEIECQC